MIYFGAPFVLGWALCTLAARQRLRAWWPVVGMFLVACITAVQRVDANRATISGFGHIHVGFVIGPSPEGLMQNLLQAMVLFTASLLPYLIWRWREGRSTTA